MLFIMERNWMELKNKVYLTQTSLSAQWLLSRFNPWLGSHMPHSMAKLKKKVHLAFNI